MSNYDSSPFIESFTSFRVKSLINESLFAFALVTIIPISKKCVRIVIGAKFEEGMKDNIFYKEDVLNLAVMLLELSEAMSIRDKADYYNYNEIDNLVFPSRNKLRPVSGFMKNGAQIHTGFTGDNKHVKLVIGASIHDSQQEYFSSRTLKELSNALSDVATVMETA
jgi:hypothetical protein